MLVAALLKVKAGSTIAERVARRAQWEYPEGAKLMAEYWLQRTDPSIPSVVALYEVDSPTPIMAALAAWPE